MTTNTCSVVRRLPCAVLSLVITLAACGGDSGGGGTAATDAGTDSDGLTDAADTGTDTSVDRPEGCESEFFALTVSEDMVLTKACSPYIISLAIQISSATLTIEPGVEIRTSGTVQVNGPDGVLIAEGTEAEPIVFVATAMDDEEPRWDGIHFEPGTGAGSVVSHAILNSCGVFAPSSPGREGCIRVNDAPAGTVTLENIEFRDAAAGVVIDSEAGPLASISGLTFDADTEVGMLIHARHVGEIDEAFTYDGNYNMLTGGRANAQVDTSGTWIAQGVPYRVIDDIHVQAPSDWEDGDDVPELTLDEGLELLFDPEMTLVVGDDRPGAIVVTGSDLEPVVFDAWETDDSSGQFEGLVFGSETQDSDLDFLHIIGGGYGPAYGCLSILAGVDADITVNHSTFEDCEGAGVGGDRAPVTFHFAEFDDNTFINSPYGLRVQPNVLRTVSGNQTYGENLFANAIIGGVAGRASGKVTLPATWAAQGVSYNVIDPIEVDADLTLTAGLTLNFEEDTMMRVAENEAAHLIATGEDGVPVTFAAADGERGGWQGIVFYPNTLNTTNLTYVVIRDGGDSNGNLVGGCVTVRGADTGPISIVNTQFLNCAQAGLAAEGAGSHFQALAGNQFTDIAVGMSLHSTTIGDIIAVQGYTGVPINQIVEGPLTEAATWINQEIPWRFKDPNTIQEVEAMLTVEAGTVFEFPRTRPFGGGFEVGVDEPGGLVFAGTESDPIVLTSAEDSPAAEDWDQILFHAKTMANSSLTHVHFEYSGQGGATIELTNAGANVTITAPDFSNGGTPDIKCTNSTPVLVEIPGGATVDGCEG